MSIESTAGIVASACGAIRRMLFCFLSGLALVAAAIGLTALLLAPAALAQDGPPPHDGPWSIDVGGGAIVYNTYPGSKSYQALPVPYFNINYDDTVFATFPDLLKVDVLRAVTGTTHPVQAGPLLQFRFGRTRHDSSQLEGLKNVGNTVAAGAYASWTLTDWLTLNADVSQGLSTNSGLLGNVGATLSHRFGPLLVAGGPTAGFTDGTYMNSFYRVTPSESAASGRPAYNAHGGLLAPGAAVTLVMPVTDKIAVTAIANYQRLVGSAADSPIVKQGGSANQVFGAVFITYSLF